MTTAICSFRPQPLSGSALASLAVMIAAAAGQAQTISFDNSCGSHLWHHSCSNFVPPNHCYCTTNWDTGTVETENCSGCAREPGAADDVFIGNIYVNADATVPIHSLTTTSLFRNSYVISVSGAAYYGGPVVCTGEFIGAGSHTFAQLLTPDIGGYANFEWPATIYFNGNVELADGAGFGIYTTAHNNSTVTWRGNGANTFIIDGAYGAGPQAVFKNQPGALLLATGDGTIRGIIGTGYVDNAGTVRKDGGTGVTDIASVLTNRPAGLLDVRTGKIVLNGVAHLEGSAALSAGTQLEIRSTANVPTTFITTGPGSLRISTVLTIDAGATATLPHLDMGSDGQSIGTRDGPGDMNLTGTASLGRYEGGVTTIMPGGTATDGAQVRIANDGTRLDNRGTLNWGDNGFEIGGGAIFRNLADGTLSCIGQGIMGGYGFTTGSATNAGVVKKSAGGPTQFALPFTNTGTVRAEAGRLRFTLFTQTAGQTVLAGGELDCDYQQQPLRFQGGSLTGSGNIRGPVENPGGIVAPGASPGVITISGGFYGNTYTQGSGGTLDVQIGGLTPGTEYDQLAIFDSNFNFGWAQIAGTLKVRTINGFTGGGDFDVLTANHGVSGTFNTLDLPPGVTVSYLPDRVRVHIPSCPADIGVQGGEAGHDGLLDNNDFVVFITLFFSQDPRADFGQQGGFPPGDNLFDNNDFVVFIDAFFDGCS